jgi:predicted DNA-binding transcriptional regulator YafY
VSDNLYGYEGIREGVSKRTIQLDIQVMRSEKLGYNAPIIVVDKKYYTYEDPKFSITKSKLGRADIEKMHEIVGFLKQLSGFSFFDEMNEVVLKLESNLNRNKTEKKSLIQFESNVLLKGLQFINPLYQAILQKQALLITYQSFKAKGPQEDIYFPYLLKEYRNRWFLIAKNKKTKILLTLALDRIIAFQILLREPFNAEENIDFSHYFDDIIGVTKPLNMKARKIFLLFSPDAAPYILTKPLHASQIVLNQDEKGTVVCIEVILNYELEREILGFGETVKVLNPQSLAKRIKERLQKNINLYE